MKNKIFGISILLSIVFSFLFISSCEKEEVYPDTTQEFYSLMTDWYLWNDSIEDVVVENYASPSDLLEAMRYEPRDKWSYISTKEAHSQYYEEGSFVGYGFGHSPDPDGNIRITYVFEDSDLYGFGIRRAYKINKINGSSVDENSDLNSLLGANDVGVENTFEFESPTNEIITKTVSKKLVKMNTVVYKNIITAGTDKIGYFVFKSFIGPSIDEITKTFDYFRTGGIDELVIDLRYNGGGRMDVVNHLAGLVIPDNVDGQLFFGYVHNNNKSTRNIGCNFEQNANSLRLNKVYFIAGKGSASASEAIINGLGPYIDVYIIGDDTYGKPVGMYSFESNVSNLMYVPITFKLVNANNYGGYYDGLKADSYVGDDVKHYFGEGEAVFDEVSLHIQTGSFTSTKSSYDIFRKPFKEIRNLKDEIGSL